MSLGGCLTMSRKHEGFLTQRRRSIFADFVRPISLHERMIDIILAKGR